MYTKKYYTFFIIHKLFRFRDADYPRSGGCPRDNDCSRDGECPRGGCGCHLIPLWFRESSLMFVSKFFQKNAPFLKYYANCTVGHKIEVTRKWIWSPWYHFRIFSCILRKDFFGISYSVVFIHFLNCYFLFCKKNFMSFWISQHKMWQEIKSREKGRRTISTLISLDMEEAKNLEKPNLGHPV